MALSFLEIIDAVCVAAAVSIRSALEYAIRGPRLPSWTLKYQLRRDIMHALISRTIPPVHDDAQLATTDVYAYASSMQRKSPPAVFLTPEQGISRTVHVPANSVNLDTLALDDIGVASQRLLSLISSDKKQQGDGRMISCELIAAVSAIRALEQHADAGHESMLTCAPLHSSEQLVLHFHGGGFIVGQAAAYRQILAKMSEGCGSRILSVDYRLAPFHPFPAQIHDALIAYKYVLQQGFLPENIVLAGDSSGASLCVALSCLLRRLRMPLPSALVLLSPRCNLVDTHPSTKLNADYDYMAMPALESPLSNSRLYYSPGQPLTPEMVQEMRDPLVSPAFADLHGLPPTLVQAGGREQMIDEITALADKIKSQNPERPDAVVFESYDDMCHVFQNMLDIDQSIAAHASIAQFVRALRH
ncbi:hypothetical protein H4R99_000614 [Coemansia sp. RSA 1722]|nr:hypothetical protein LPJ57_004353 [Coemansia sp. RSA 486]KAJ2237892.1 hypothetical protein IWW45_000497 [Coemansia sp. RSA 485]KAJ2606061.1 hypothetical protein H4R99_000614 [Coemansia sp. RSA 1722]